MDDFNEAPALAEQSPAPEPQATPEPQETPEQQPEPKQEKPRSRRESIEKALKDIGVQDEPESAPEPNTDDGAAKSEAKPDANGEKSGEKAQSQDEGQQPRGPDGKFVAKDGETTKEGEQAKDDGAQQTDSKTTTLAEPPARFSPDAKEAWKDAPEPVRAEIHRAVREMESGLQQKDQQLEPLKPYYDMAQQHGVKLEDALGNYVRMEQMLRQNPVQGFQHLARNMGLSPQQVAAMLTGQQGEGQQAQDPRDQEITRLHREMEQMRQQFGGLNQTVQSQQEAAITQQVQDFAAKNEHFDALSEDIAAILQSGQATDLQGAYDMALEKAQRIAGHFAPQPPELEPAPQAQAAQTRPARSVTGAPNAGSNPGARQPSKNRTEALQRAFQRAGLG